MIQIMVSLATKLTRDGLAASALALAMWQAWRFVKPESH